MLHLAPRVGASSLAICEKVLRSAGVLLEMKGASECRGVARNEGRFGVLGCC